MIRCCSRISRALALGGVLLLIVPGCDSQRGKDPAASGDDAPMVVSASGARAYHIIRELEEIGTASGTFTVLESEGASGGNSLGIPALGEDFKGEEGTFAWSVDIPVAGPAHIWFRVRWSGTCGNTVYLAPPVGPQVVVGGGATYNTWHWIKLMVEPRLPAGEAKFIFRQREDDIRIDQVLITSDADYVPVGIEQE